MIKKVHGIVFSKYHFSEFSMQLHLCYAMRYTHIIMPTKMSIP